MCIKEKNKLVHVDLKVVFPRNSRPLPCADTEVWLEHSMHQHEKWINLCMLIYTCPTFIWSAPKLIHTSTSAHWHVQQAWHQLVAIWQLNSAAVLFLCRMSMRSGWKHVLAGHYPAAVGHRKMEDNKLLQQLRLNWKNGYHTTEHERFHSRNDKIPTDVSNWIHRVLQSKFRLNWTFESLNIDPT